MNLNRNASPWINRGTLLLCAVILHAEPALAGSGLDELRKLFDSSPSSCQGDSKFLGPSFTKSTYTCRGPKSSGRGASKPVEITIFHGNDNKLLGLFGAAGGKDGNDLGLTSSFSLIGKFPANERKGVRVTLQNEFYTAPVFFEKSIAENQFERVVRDPQGNVLSRSQGLSQQYDTPWKEFYKNNPIRSVDVSRLLVQLKEGKSFFYTVEAGVEARSRKQGFGGHIQDSWHDFLGIYRFEYLSPERREALYKTDLSTQVIYSVPSGAGGMTPVPAYKTDLSTDVIYSVFSGAGGMTPVPAPYAQRITTFTEQSSTLVKPAVGREFLKHRIAPFAGILNVGAGVEETFNESGICTLTGEASSTANLVFENGGLGQNTRLANRVVLAVRVRNLQVKGGLNADYYLMEGDDLSKDSAPLAQNRARTHWGVGKSIEMSYDIGKGAKRKVRYTPFLSLTTQSGRLPFEEFNDPDSQFNFGFRMRFR